MRSLVSLVSLVLPSIALAQPAQPPPPPGYGAPVYAPLPAQTYRQGLTFEANIGLGIINFSDDDESESEGALGGISLGVGGWLNDRVAITGRLSPVTYRDSGDGYDAQISAIFLGPSVQYWLDDKLWVGGGIGLGIAYASIDIDGLGSDSDSRTGFGADLRAGYTFSSNAETTFNVSAELTPSFFEDEPGQGSAGRLTGFAVMFGYQHL